MRAPQVREVDQLHQAVRMKLDPASMTAKNQPLAQKSSILHPENRPDNKQRNAA